jgi:uncharacterized membrane protein HdeD (DUF308 family)
MKLGYRYGRIIVLVILSILAGGLRGDITGFSMYFGAGLLVAAFLSLIYLFVNFDKSLDEKLLMEMILDGFSGLIIFTYPHSDNTFFIVVFSFWIALMGIFMLSAGLFSEKNKEDLWFYVLLGLVMIVSGFSIMHVTEESQGVTGYFISFITFIYACAACRLLWKKKSDIY